MLRLPANARAALFALTAFAFFSTHDVIVKTLGAHYAPQQIVFFSALMGFPILTLMLIRDGTPGTLRPRHPWWMALRTGSAVMTGLCGFYAFSQLALAQAYALIFASPLLITLLSIPILGERVGPRRAAAVAVGLAGVLIVLQPGSAPLTLGHVAGLAAAGFGALSAVVMRRIGREERSAVLMVYPMLTNIVVMGAMLPFVYQPMPALHVGGLGTMAVLAFIATTLLIGAYRRGQAVIVAPMQYSQILWAVAFGLIFFGERPMATDLLGIAVIVSSGVYIVLREDRRRKPTGQPVTRSRGRADTGTYARGGPIVTGRPQVASEFEPWDR